MDDEKSLRDEVIIGEVTDAINHALTMLVERIATRVDVHTDEGKVNLTVQVEGRRVTCMIDNLL